MKECYFSIDIETTGPVPELYSMYELGACVVGKESEQFFDQIKLLSYDSYEPSTLRAMGTDIDVLRARSPAHDPEYVMYDFAAWVTRVARNKRPVFVANNAPFDWMFTAWYFEKFKITNPFGYSALDMKAYFMGKTNCSWRNATLKKMADHCGIPFEKLPHRALEDAIIQSQIFSALLRSTEKS